MIPPRFAILKEAHLIRSCLHLCWSLAAALLVRPCSSQVDGDGWFVSAGGSGSYTYEMRLIGGQYQAVSGFTGLGSNPGSGGTCISRTGEVYFVSIFSTVNWPRSVMAAQRNTQGVYSLRSVLNPMTAAGVMEVAGDTLWLLEQYTGRVYSWPTHGATQQPFVATLLSSGPPGMCGVWRRMAGRCSLVWATASMLSILSPRRSPPASSLGK